jgi:hypothetical protein
MLWDPSTEFHIIHFLGNSLLYVYFIFLIYLLLLTFLPYTKFPTWYHPLFEYYPVHSHLIAYTQGEGYNWILNVGLYVYSNFQYCVKKC